MFMPAPTEANTTISPLFKWWLLSFPLCKRSNMVGKVATELLPSQEMVIGIMCSGIFSILYNLNSLDKIAKSIF